MPAPKPDSEIERVLVVAAHPDDADFGAAGTIAGWTDAEGQAALCASIEDSLAAVENPMGTLADMGYGNPALGAGDFCP